GALDPVGYRATSARVTGETGSPSAALLAGWLSARLGVEATCLDDDGPGITAAEIHVETSAGTQRVVTVGRPDGRTATLSVSGEMDRQLPLARRQLGDLLTEELRRLDADPVYAEALAAATGSGDLGSRPGSRTHVWRDPMRTMDT
ncbi:MAG: OpcA/G6PD domain-containing protein, partial [Acidimicrobiales bacterium]